MKLRFSFSLKILFPYLLIASIFSVVLSRLTFFGDGILNLLSLSGIFISIVAGVLHYLWLRKPLNRLRTITEQLTSGILPVFFASKSKDDLGTLERNLAKLIENLRSHTLFTRSMASGDLRANYEKRGSDDELGEALLTLKGSLIASKKESEARRRDEENRSWAAHGLAKFSKLFREAEDDLHEFSRELMRELVAYTEADVGALFITTGADAERPVLQMAGSYAFDRQEFRDQSFEFGEGLVGRAALEEDLIYITELPPDFMKIRTDGLGQDVPSSLLLVPVILDSNVLGVIELASLGEIPAFQARLFIQQLADALATTIAKVKANQKNRELLEQSRKQAQEFKSQELVFRQKLESLQREIDRLKDTP